ncbi:uncharacterized protein METZ01_LOCUS477541, partial [marine metagenome]
GSITKTLYYAFMILCFVLTPYFVVVGNIWVNTGLMWTCISMAALMLMLVTNLVLCHELHLKKKNIFLFPLGAIVMVAIMINSMIQVVFLGRAQWRGRTYKQ